MAENISRREFLGRYVPAALGVGAGAAAGLIGFPSIIDVRGEELLSKSTTEERVIHGFGGLARVEAKAVAQNGKDIVAAGTGPAIFPKPISHDIVIGQIDGKFLKFNSKRNIFDGWVLHPKRVIHAPQADSPDIVIVEDDNVVNPQNIVYRLNEDTKQADLAGTLPLSHSVIGNQPHMLYGSRNGFFDGVYQVENILRTYDLRDVKTENTPPLQTIDLEENFTVETIGRFGDRIVVVGREKVMMLNILSSGFLSHESTHTLSSRYAGGDVPIVYEDRFGNTHIARSIYGQIIELYRLDHDGIELTHKLDINELIRNVGPGYKNHLWWPIRVHNGFILVSQNAVVLLNEDGSFEKIERDHPYDLEESLYYTTLDANPELVGDRIISLQGNGDLREITSPFNTTPHKPKYLPALHK